VAVIEALKASGGDAFGSFSLLDLRPVLCLVLRPLTTKYRTTLKTYCESGTFARGMERVDPIFYGDPLTVAMKALGMN